MYTVGPAFNLRFCVLCSGVELAAKGWKESLSASYSSSTSGNWSWDASDQSVPSTPSPPLTNDAGKNFLLSSQSDDNIEENESTHFLFEDPIPRKRKVGLTHLINNNIIYNTI